jgi:hypothetical protein
VEVAILRNVALKGLGSPSFSMETTWTKVIGYIELVYNSVQLSSFGTLEVAILRNVAMIRLGSPIPI